MRVSVIVKFALVWSVLVLPLSAAAQDDSVPADVKRIVSCVKALAPKDIQSEIFGKAGRVTVRVGMGPISGTSGGLEGDDVRNVAFVARNGRRAFLFFARPLPGKVEVDSLGYELEKAADGWHVTEGNGGQATYEAIKQYFESMPQYSILKPASPRTLQCVRLHY
ncbi:hypothetical protein [Corallococcus sp. Z5C101001]|uniref:hypothetical protein n=1 Tax=Corallococcus sp. Z5C101001 TaxID=2596829 RepID=UPI00117FD377|nr:hypothetical protein [Corallococcus sp. Z5C101001]TSC23452.1 hypothetical protein FOF48_30605 [Corallococcus sp. Z5C101001]